MVYLAKKIVNIAMNDILKIHPPKAFFYQKSITQSCDVEIHIHDAYEIFQPLTDNVQYFVEGNRYDLKKGDLMITDCHEIHRPVTRDETAYGRRFIQFSPLAIPNFSDNAYNPLKVFTSRKPGTMNHLNLSQSDLEVINRQMDLIESGQDLNTPKSLYQSRLAFATLLAELNDLYKVTIPPKIQIPAIIDQVISYLEDTHTHPFSLEIISQKFHMNRYRLSHLFKDTTGFTMLEYVQSKRIQTAKTLLQKDVSIAEISRQCGYEYYSNFYITFKKLTGLSPRAYQKQSQ